MKRILLAVLCMLALSVTVALADDVCVIAGDALRSGVETDRDYVSIVCPVETPGQVLVSIYGRNGGLVWQRDYGVCTGSVCTEEIYLRLQGTVTTYQAEVRVGADVYSFPIVRRMARMRHNAACTAGYPLRSIVGGNTWESATILDVQAAEGQMLIVPVYASETYALGSASLTVRDGTLIVTMNLADGVDADIDSAKVWVAASALDARLLGQRNFAGTVGGINQPIRFGDAAYIAVYVDLEVSFDPATAPIGVPVADPQQTKLWQQMLEYTDSEAVG